MKFTEGLARRWCAALAGSALLTIAAPAAFAQSAGKSPMNSAPASDYPDGSRLNYLYQQHADAPVMPGVRAGAEAMEVGAAAARELQSRLPEGFTLAPAQSVHVMSRAPKVATDKESLANLETGPGKVVTLARMRYHGVPLAPGSDYLSIASDDGRVLLTRQRNVPSSVDAATPTVTPAAAANMATSAARSRAGRLRLTADAPVLEVWVDSAAQGHLAWNVRVTASSMITPVAMRYWIAATGTPRVLASENEVYHTHHGQATGTVWNSTELATSNVTSNRGLSSMSVSRSTDAVTALTGPDGRYSYTTGGGNATISGALSGTNSVIANLGGAVMTAAGTGTTAPDVNLHFGAASEFEIAQTSGFYWTNVAHDLAASILLPTDLPNLPTNVNVNGSCNAFWNGSSISFFRAGGGCPNMAYSDVVFHEYGHGVDARKGNILDGGYSEGFGDALAVLGTRQSCVGRDFFGAGTCLRDASAVILWPPAPGEGVHARGRRYAGFVWELTQQLRNTYSEEEAFRLATELVLASAAANPASIPDAVFLSFVADDTDGNLATCSPHFAELAAAADSRAIPRPPNCAALGGGSPGSSNHFPWTQFKKVSSNSNILTVTLHLAEPMEVHLSANTSARSTKGKLPRTFTTGLWDQPAVNVMWTNSLRDVTILKKNTWVNFSTMIGVQMPAGDHTFFWKIWTSGGELEFDSGTLLAEAFIPSPARRRAMAMAADGSRDAKDLETTTIDAKNKRSVEPAK